MQSSRLAVACPCAAAVPTVLPAPLAACGLPPARPPCGLAGRWQSSRRRAASPPGRRRFPAGWPARLRPPPVPTPPRRCAAACGMPVSPRRAPVSASPPLAGRLPSPPSVVALRAPPRRPAPPTRQARVRNGRYARSQGAERIGDLGMHGLEWPVGDWISGRVGQNFFQWVGRLGQNGNNDLRGGRGLSFLYIFGPNHEFLFLQPPHPIKNFSGVLGGSPLSRER